MGVGPVGFSAEQQDQLWGMWRGGESLRTMERSLAVSLPRIQRFLRQTGGIRPLSQRRREGRRSDGTCDARGPSGCCAGIHRAAVYEPGVHQAV